MLKNLIIIICCLFGFQLLGQAQDSEVSSIYPFDNQYLDLNSLDVVEMDDLPAQSFKTNSIYANRFKGLAIDRLAHKGKLFEVVEDNGLLMKDLQSKAALVLPNKEKGAERLGQHFLIESIDGVVYIKYLSAAHGFKIYKYDASGKEVWGIQLAHSDSVTYGKISYQRPFLNYFTHTPWQIVFNSYVKEKAKTYVIESSSGQVLEYDFTAKGIIRDEEKDAFVFGFVQLDEESNQLHINYRTTQLQVALNNYQDCNQIETLVKDTVLYLAAFNNRDAGAYLIAVDLNTKKIIWERSIQNTGNLHLSEKSSFNMIWLSAFEDKLLLEAKESKVKYLKVIDLKSGLLIKEFSNN